MRIYQVLSARGIIFKENKTKILLARRLDDGYWVIPGGKLEKGENSRQAVIREIKEETGLVVEILRKLGDYYRPNKILDEGKGLHTQIFLCREMRGRFLKNGETSEIEYFDINKLPNEMRRSHREQIKEALNYNGKEFFIYRK